MIRRLENAHIGSASWTDLREQQASFVVEHPMSTEAKAEFMALADGYERRIFDRFRRRFPWIVNDMAADLINTARARITGHPSPFFEELFAVYSIGGFPIGWSGPYPEGSPIVLWLEEQRG